MDSVVCKTFPRNGTTILILSLGAAVSTETRIQEDPGPDIDTVID
jgi:hypothetical protein